MSAPERRPWVKICGVTRPADADAALAFGADFLGLNFWPGSPRAVDAGAAREIAAAARGRAPLVGVFVNELPERVAERVAELDLEFVQLHGDESELERERWGDRLVRVVRGDRLGATAVESVAPFAYLVDAPRAAGDAPGGAGVAWAWGAARAWVAAAPRPVLVAGGVRPGNVAAALAATGAAGVDVASGVESSPGVKDHERMRRLFEEVRGGTT
ncbi:MAG: phosphoribosylanthranilate isomerase [Thermoanaerobaculia bacterium]|nr:phosphoribosylanthranilate isomerase [Thermoanaerobaculia bacterium]